MLSNLTISGCSSGYGAVYNDGKLSVMNSTFSSNGGGAILNWGFGNSTGRPGGKLSVTNSTFSGNGFAGDGAILNMRGTLSVTKSTFSGNSAGGRGGAIASSCGGKLTVTNSTFSGNSAGKDGGAIDTLSDINCATRLSRLTVKNTTFSGNSAGGRGGAIDNGGPLTVTNSTFFDNSVSNGEGGAIANEPFSCRSQPCRATVTNTIVANSPAGGNCFGPLTDGGHNLDDGATCGFTAAGSLSNTDPQLDPTGLADNGGPTQTIGIQAGSPAINAGDEKVCKSKLKNLDQRGYVRPGTGATNCSIGAYEFDSPGCPKGKCR